MKALLASDLIRNIVSTFATRAGLMVLGLGTAVLVARILGPEGRGLYAVAASFAAIGVQVGNLGLHTANTYFVARDRTRLPTMIANSLVIALSLGGGTAFVLWWVFSVRPHLAPFTNFWLLLVMLAWLPLGQALLLMQRLLIGLEKIRLFNLAELATGLLTIGLIGLAIVSGVVTPASVLAASVIAVAVTAVGILLLLSRQANGWFRPSMSLFREHARYGFKAYLASLSAFLVIRIDLLMVQYMLGAEQSGYYSVAAQLANSVYMLPVVVGTILFPRLSAIRNEAERWALTRRAATSLAGIMIAISIVGWAASGWAIPFIFGDPYRPAVVPFNYLLIAIILLSVNTVFMNYFAAKGMPSIAITAPASALIVNVAANFVAIPRWGISGAAWASVLGYGWMLVMSMWYLWKQRSREGLRGHEVRIR